MDHPVSLPQTRLPSRTCVWMDAGILAYKLCDRGFDCSNCPLDAALRGRPGPARSDGHAPSGERTAFPTDRRFSTGHAWLRILEQDPPSARLGLDAFAAALIGDPLGFRRLGTGRSVGPGKAICRIELAGGALTIGAPVSGHARLWNGALDEDPGLLRRDPYRKGWLVEWTPDSGNDLDTLLDAAAAQRQAELDGKRFRRAIAFRLLADANGDAKALGPDTDLRGLLGPEPYLSVLKELIR